MVLGGATAGAQALPTRVRLEALPCASPPFAEDLWRRLVRTELQTEGVDEVLDDVGAGEAAAVIRLEFGRCAVDATDLSIVIDDALTRKSVRRVVDLGDVPTSGRPRALALAVAELLRSSWTELATAPSPPAPAPEPSPPPSLRRVLVQRLRAALPPLEPPAPPPVRQPSVWSLGASMSLQSFPSANAALLGGRAVVTHLLRALPLRLRLDLGATAGTAFDPLGEIDLQLATTGVSLGIVGGSERFAFEIGPRIELGWAWVQGRPSVAGVRGETGDAGTVLGSLLATLRARVTNRGWLVLDVTVGASLREITITSGTMRTAGITGPALGLGLGFVVSP